MVKFIFKSAYVYILGKLRIANRDCRRTCWPTRRGSAPGAVGSAQRTVEMLAAVTLSRAAFFLRAAWEVAEAAASSAAAIRSGQDKWREKLHPVFGHGPIRRRRQISHCFEPVPEFLTWTTDGLHLTLLPSSFNFSGSCFVLTYQLQCNIYIARHGPLMMRRISVTPFQSARHGMCQ